MREGGKLRRKMSLLRDLIKGGIKACGGVPLLGRLRTHVLLVKLVWFFWKAILACACF